MAPSPSSSTSAAASASSSAASGTISVSGNLKIVGILLAISSGLLIGSSFVFKKKGLIRSQRGQVAGEGVAYLKSPLWWTGMSMMILGEICNFVAYAFVEAIVVTPMGALSVVICAILSHFFLAEKLSFFGWLGCGLCIVGSVVIALNGPQEDTPGQILAFQKMFLAPGFLAYASTLIVASLVIIFVLAPRYGTKSMLWYIMVCSMIGGISVSVTTGLGAAIVTSVQGDNQFKHWFTYFLLGFIVVTLVTEVFYLNKALALFNTAMVTPTYYVIFTFFSMLTTIVLFQGLSAPATQIITLVMGFIVICFGITILQLSKIDPAELKLDRRSTILLQAAKRDTEGMDEKNLASVEEPGMDALRGTFGMVGSVIRARSAHRMSMSSKGSIRSRYSNAPPLPGGGGDPLAGLKRHQLWDPPVPSRTSSMADLSSTADKATLDERASVFSASRMSDATALGSPVPRERKQTIKFDSQDVVHSYHVPGTGDNSAIHERRGASHHNSMSPPPKSVSGHRG
ncbi:magnesium transporter NIPA-domain-containing protein [Fomitopsis serialis]|uniref:magnesium transporter NIPA-domain-containing protein n=1 Tax=Fomitopsis serialis TaxID=139415 RepID=UPI0020082BFE|nr:magnesium transporter NIPA-domain-containing protein [Neoantrodia serialis]KAH9932637.1 magnesium transporter NIPA-domain-containing protein [Neoantrodia serialis]